MVLKQARKRIIELIKRKPKTERVFSLKFEPWKEKLPLYVKRNFEYRPVPEGLLLYSKKEWTARKEKKMFDKLKKKYDKKIERFNLRYPYNFPPFLIKKFNLEKTKIKYGGHHTKIIRNFMKNGEKHTEIITIRPINKQNNTDIKFIKQIEKQSFKKRLRASDKTIDERAKILPPNDFIIAEVTLQDSKGNKISKNRVGYMSAMTIKKNAETNNIIENSTILPVKKLHNPNGDTKMLISVAVDKKYRAAVKKTDNAILDMLLNDFVGDALRKEQKIIVKAETLEAKKALEKKDFVIVKKKFGKYTIYEYPTKSDTNIKTKYSVHYDSPPTSRKKIEGINLHAFKNIEWLTFQQYKQGLFGKLTRKEKKSLLSEKQYRNAINKANFELLGQNRKKIHQLAEKYNINLSEIKVEFPY